MKRHTLLFCVASLAILTHATFAGAAGIRGQYLESRTCDVYTGPCFANAEVGLAGQEAILAWSIDQGEFNGVVLDGLKVVMAVRASDTLGFGGGLVVRPDPIRSVVYVDEKATDAQRAALVEFAKNRAGVVAGEVVRVDTAPIQMTVDHVDMVARLTAGKAIGVETRKLGVQDCVCTNEMLFYPPLTAVENSAAAMTVAANFSGRGLGTHWSNLRSRSAYLATFGY